MNEEFKSNIHSIYSDLESILIAKNLLYGDSFNKTIKKYGIIAGIIRLTDKWNRLEEIVSHGDLDKPALIDTLKDLANYSILILNILQNEQRKVDKSS